MNERIRELAEQAGFETDRGPLIAPGPYIKVGRLCVEVPLEKFAELIVRECAKIADSADESACEWIGGNILTHFGVEE
ncbi:MAG: hypothetical protein RLZZ196_688 [Bacteroidota bacterium]|jgi:hypothetical protein